MKVNTKIRYGFRAMIEIAKNMEGGTGVYQKDISKNQEISNKYLDQIVHGLKVAKLIRKKTKKGGYILTKASSEISLLDIYNAFEPHVCVIECLENELICNREDFCEAKGFWGTLNLLIKNHYKSFTLEDLVLKKITVEDDVKVS